VTENKMELKEQVCAVKTRWKEIGEHQSHEVEGHMINDLDSRNKHRNDSKVANDVSQCEASSQ
jgi:hypothetical protein